jgi:hypothetical protein
MMFVPDLGLERDGKQMDGLIVKKKWSDLILNGCKDLEIRGCNTKKRGVIAIIESGTGLIKGEVELYNSTPFSEKIQRLYGMHWLTEHQIKELSYRTPYAWWLEHPVRYDSPIPYEHPQGAVIWVKDVLGGK